MIERILNWAVPLVGGSVVTYCVTWWRMQRKKNTALEEGVPSGFEDATYFTEV